MLLDDIHAPPPTSHLPPEHHLPPPTTTREVDLDSPPPQQTTTSSSHNLLLPLLDLPTDMDKVVLPIELTPSQVRPVAYRVISKKHGLNLKTAALEVLAQHLGHHFGAEWKGAKAEKFLEDLCKLWKQEDRGLFVDGAPLSQIIQNLLNAQASETATVARQDTLVDQEPRMGLVRTMSTLRSGDQRGKRFHWRDYFKVVSANDTTRLVYNHQNHHFELAPQRTQRALGAPKSLVDMLPTRFHILFDKILRDERFQDAVFASLSNASSAHTITRVKNMLGRPLEEFTLFGMLTRLQGDHGEVWLLDQTASVALEFTQATEKVAGHYYPQGSFAMVCGVYTDGKFQVSAIGPPIYETREKASEAYGHLDFYGLFGQSSSSIERIDSHLLEIMAAEEATRNHRFVILGCEIHLDKTSHIDALRLVLNHLNKDPPAALIMPGSFVSKPMVPGNAVSTYKDAMNSLAQLIAGAPNLAQKTKIVIVPGDNDPWHSMHSAGATPPWPLCPVPAIFTPRVRMAAKDVVFASNPTRLLYLTQEIVVARDDYTMRFRQSELADVPVIGDQTEDQDKMQTDTRERQETQNTDDLDPDQEGVKRALNDLIQEPSGAPKEKFGTPESDRLMATILDQAHLAPFAPRVRPTIWEQDHALSLAQWPTILVLVDPTTPQFRREYEGCNVMNPGLFIYSGRACWMDLWPSTGNSAYRDILL